MLDFWLGILNSKNATSNVKKSGQPFYDSFYFLTDNVNSRDTISSISAEAPLSEVHYKKKWNKKGSKKSSLPSQEEAWFSNETQILQWITSR